MLPKEAEKMYDSIDMEIYSKLKDRRLITIKNPQNFSKKLIDNLQSNSGELYSIALAIEQNMLICLDDGNPYNFCLQENLSPINSVDFIQFLYLKKEINSQQAIEYVSKLQGKMKPKYIENGKKLFY
jgi:predicted nucleic acid-binding protein